MSGYAYMDDRARYFVYTLHDAAEMLSVSQRSLERLIHDGEVESVKVKRGRRVPHDALVAYIDKLNAAS